MKRDIGNPNRVFSNDGKCSIKHSELNQQSFEKIVGCFEARITSWYFNLAKELSKDTQSNFMVMGTCCILIDLFSQYFYGRLFSSQKYFIKFIDDYLGKYNKAINPPINTLISYKNDIPQKCKIKTVAQGLFVGFRCGIVHSARILEFGRINRNDQVNAITVLPWNEGGKSGVEIQINPLLLLNELEVIFRSYIQKLKNNDPNTVKHFKKKFAFEYGTAIKSYFPCKLDHLRA